MGLMEGNGEIMRLRMARLLVGVALFALLLIGPALFASADEGGEPSGVVTAQEESPYTPPSFESVDVPSWMEPLEPLARLPLWGQAAVLSAGVAGMFFVLPMAFKWVWNLGEDPTEGSGSRS